MSFDLYPFIKGWKYEDVSPQTKSGIMNVGGKPFTYDVEGPASIKFVTLAIGGSIDAKYSRIIGEVIKEGAIVARPLYFTIYELFTAAQITNDFVPFVSRYDETQGEYVISAGTSSPGYIVVRKGEILHIEVQPPLSPVELTIPSSFIYEFGISYRKFYEEAEKELKDIIGGKVG